MISAVWFFADAGLSVASNQPATPGEVSQVQGESGDSRVRFGPCWATVHNTHNSDNNPGRNYVQAKTNVYCRDPLAPGETLTVESRIYVELPTSGWHHMETNVGVCPGRTGTTSWVNCWDRHFGHHRIMESSVSVLCAVGSTSDYVHYSRAQYRKADGSTYQGSAFKFSTDVECEGAGN